MRVDKFIGHFMFLQKTQNGFIVWNAIEVCLYQFVLRKPILVVVGTRVPVQSLLFIICIPYIDSS